MTSLPTIDARDVVYASIGLALLLLTLQPALSRFRILNFPFIYVLLGVALVGIGFPTLDPRPGGLAAKVIEHASELIVIISLAGAGLAIDTKMTWRNWNPTFRLLIVTMPLTIAAVALAGTQMLGLPLAGALLLAAALAPTDPVLARTVQVAPPGKGEEPMEVALTAEAGLNDGLAFPFIYLAISVATYGWVAGQGVVPDWFAGWLGFDFAYRVVAGWLGGLVVGWAVTRIAFSRWGDAENGAWNSILMVLAATLISYGLVEAIDGYGFLAAFAAARAGRAFSRDREEAEYERYVHHGADQLESILLVLLLIWLGTFLAIGGLAGWTWAELAFAAGLIFVVRPVAGLIGLIGVRCKRVDRIRIAFFGVRGMGSVFYIAYAQNHAEFESIEAVWRVAAMVIVGSIVIHGFGANYAIAEPHDEDEGGEELHPHREHDMEQERPAAE